MPRRNANISKKINLLDIIKEEVFINEIFDKEIPTEYQIIDFGSHTTFRFQTNLQTFYDVEFHESYEYGDTAFESDNILENYFPDQEIVPCIDVGFTLTERENKDDSYEYEKESNKHEYIELFGRIVYILKKENKKKSSYNLFVIGFSKRNKNEIYYQIVKRHFSNDFYIESGDSSHHYGGNSLFLIRK